MSRIIKRFKNRIKEFSILEILLTFISILLAFVGNSVSKYSNELSEIGNGLSSSSILYSSQYTEPLVEVEMVDPFNNEWCHPGESCNDINYDGNSTFKYIHHTSDLFTLEYGTMYWLFPITHFANYEEIYVMDLLLNQTHFSAIKGHTQGSTHYEVDRLKMNKSGELSISVISDDGELDMRYKRYMELEDYLIKNDYPKIYFLNTYFVIQLFYNDAYGNKGNLNYIYEVFYGGGPNQLMKVTDDYLSEYIKFYKTNFLYTNENFDEETINDFLEISTKLTAPEDVLGIRNSHYGRYDLFKSD